jgi:hypothetical protein
MKGLQIHGATSSSLLMMPVLCTVKGDAVQCTTMGLEKDERKMERADEYRPT